MAKRLLLLEVKSLAESLSTRTTEE